MSIMSTKLGENYLCLETESDKKKSVTSGEMVEETVNKYK